MTDTAWKVNFNNALQSFKPNLQGVRHLIDLALGSKLDTPPTIQFASSISVYQGRTVSISMSFRV
jgi:hypothetical protein